MTDRYKIPFARSNGTDSESTEGPNADKKDEILMVKNLAENDRLLVEEQLQRSSTGFEEVMRRLPTGEPAIIRVNSIVDNQPFPTLFWLSEPGLSSLVYECESRGLTRQIQDLIDADSHLQQRITNDNSKHIELRESYFDEATRSRLQQLGIEEQFASKGIGGNANFLRVRCLHAYLACHVIEPNAVGDLVHELLDPDHALIGKLRQLV